MVARKGAGNVREEGTEGGGRRRRPAGGGIAPARTRMQAPRTSQHEIDHPRPVTDQHLDGLVVGKALAQVLVAVGERTTECRDGVGPGVE